MSNFNFAAYRHDVCYGGYDALTRPQCDNQFFADLLDSCSSVGWFLRGACRGDAEWYFAIVRHLGQSHYAPQNRGRLSSYPQ